MRKSLVNFQTSTKRTRDIIDDQDMNAALALKDAEVRERFETTRCAIVVIVSGFFESFLKETAEEFISDLCGRGVPFNSLPDHMRAAHFAGGAAVLMKRANEEKKAKANPMSDSEDVVRRLASIVGSTYDLVWEAFAEMREIPGPKTVREFLNRFAIEDSWKKLATATGMSENRLETTLKTFIALRNECAHTGRAPSIPPTVELGDYCDFMDKMATGIIQVLEDRFGQPPLVVATAPLTAVTPTPAVAPSTSTSTTTP